ncbi:SRPBCC family protein [Myxococcota bacterium]|nr:SRPBCC family protein [Myxococcota bacterium]
MSIDWHDLRKVDLDFLDTAEKTYVCEATLNAPRGAVWDAFADPSSWCHWFPGVEKASYGDSVAPFGVGTFRESWVAGQRYQEIMLAWNEPHRWGYYIERATVPVARAQIEMHEFEEHGSGTLARWIVATDPLEDLAFMADGTPFDQFLSQLFADAMAGLDRHLAR